MGYDRHVYATVILNTRQGGIGNGLTYGVPQGVFVSIGSLIKAPLRKRLIEGVVIDVQTEKPEGDYDVKEIARVLGEEPLLTKNQIDLSRWMAEYYLCHLRQTIGVWLPGGEWEKLLPEKEEFVRYTIQFPPAGRAGNSTGTKKTGKKQQELIDYLSGKDWVRWKEVKEATGADRGTLRRLVEQGLIEAKEEVAGCFDMRRRVMLPARRSFSEGGSSPSPFDGAQDRLREGVSKHASTSSAQASGATQHDTALTTTNNIILTPRQVIAHKAIKSDPRPTLLFGITGSGKTEIYAALIADAINEGKSAILLLPEILLTENFVGRFQQLVDRDAIAIIHSRLTPSERRKTWRSCREGSIRLVIGSRSALFSPLLNLSLIIIDEEHEWTYKNEQSPRYHAGKVAEKMNAKLLLGTATPSVESWFKAKSGTYQLVELPERFGGAALPSVQIVDLGNIQMGRFYPLSPTLINAIRLRLERHEQVILFLNRRGFATALLCMDCRHRFEDPETRLPYTVHFRGQRPYLLSHHTGETLDVPAQCPQCGATNLRPVGAGTQKIESLLSELFPQARLLRADADTLSSPEKMRTLLETMKEGRADILLGTQSVVKGLDLPKVTLAAVILADVGLSLPHFRAGERVFQLLTQLTGRSGRKDPGEVVIQTFRPKAIEVELASRHDVRTYLEGELAQREKVHYPPDTEMVRFVFSENAERESKVFFESFDSSRSGGTRSGQARVEKLFISRAPSLFGGGKIWQVFVRGKGVRELLKNLPVFNGIVDVDPIECL